VVDLETEQGLCSGRRKVLNRKGVEVEKSKISDVRKRVK
jgi:hypothetical protein